MRTNDNELLRRYLRDHSESAFAELVERHLGLVFSAALRQLNGDTQAAEDVAQAVFIDLARKGDRLLQHPTLTGWLYTSTRFLAGNARRAAWRRRTHELSASAMYEDLSPDGMERDWSELRPVLDEAMHDLNSADRDAVLWRYFEKLPFTEIGLRLALSENAARMRVERALDKLRVALTKRGITSTAVVLAELVTNRAIGSVPTGLAGRVCRATLATAGTGSLAAWMAALWLTSKAKMALGLVTLLAILGFILINSSQKTVSVPVKTPRTVVRSNTLFQPVAQKEVGHPNSTVDNIPAVPTDPSEEPKRFQLKLVAADSGEPVTNAEVHWSYTVNASISIQQSPSDHHGTLEVTFPSKVSRISFYTRMDNFADTRLSWDPERGEVIPKEYVLRLARSVPFGGRVVNAQGASVSGAIVQGFSPYDSLGESQRETHLAEFKAETDATGQWQCRRVAPELIRSLWLHARHGTHGTSKHVKVTSNVEIERQLLEGTYVLRLGEATVLQGFVVTPEGIPIEGAKILLGKLSTIDSKQTRSQADGSFELGGVPVGQLLLTGNAEGFATTTLAVNTQTNTKPVQLVLSRGKALLVRIVNLEGQSISRANVWINPSRRNETAQTNPVTQLRFDGKTDATGRVLFDHVPEVDIEVCANAQGYMELFGFLTRPGGPELVLSLSPELVVMGTVRDSSTGELIPRFTILTGCPEPQGPNWSGLDRFQLSFEGGSFRHAYNEAVVSGGANSGYILKFEAEGYAPSISRSIAADERFVQLDIKLQPAPMRRLTVLNPDGTPAVGTDVAFPELARRDKLLLVPGGFAQRRTPSEGALRRTNAQGNLTYTENQKRRLVAANTNGFSEVDLLQLTNGVIQLQFWGRIEGFLPVTAGQQTAHEVYFQYQGEPDGSSILADFASSFRIQPDQNGQFVFPLVPPGQHRIVELIPSPGPELRSWKHGRAADVEVHAGATAQVTLLPKR